MGRVRKGITVNGQQRWALFDTGARNSYVIEDVVNSLPSWDLPRPEPVALGGIRHEVTREAVLIAEVEGLPVRCKVRVLHEIGADEEERPIEIIFGALAMQEWGIHPVPEEERLDMAHYPREFVEF